MGKPAVWQGDRGMGKKVQSRERERECTDHLFTKEEADELKNMGIDLYKEFAPNSDDLKGLKDGGLTSEKAKIILREGVANGKSLTRSKLDTWAGWQVAAKPMVVL